MGEFRIGEESGWMTGTVLLFGQKVLLREDGLTLM